MRVAQQYFYVFLHEQLPPRLCFEWLFGCRQCANAIDVEAAMLGHEEASALIASSKPHMF